MRRDFMLNLSHREPGAKWLAFLVVVWTTVVLGADLKAIATSIHWIATAVVLLFAAPYLLPLGKAARFPARLPALLFIAAICIPVFYGASVGYSLAEAGKVAILLLGAMPFFVTRTHLARSAFTGFVLAVSLNAVLLLGGIAGFRSAEIMALDRWGTILNYPGSLWRLAISVWCFAAYLVLARRSFPCLLLLVASTLGIFMDGARTALFLLLVGGVFLIFVLSAEAGHLKRSLLVCASGLCVAGMAFLATNALSEQGVMQRLTQVASSYQEGGYEGLEVADAVRFQMLADVHDAIYSHPILGSGVLTTTTETMVGPMAVHMTYLQVWADLGLFGLIAYVWLVWGWIRWFPAFFAHVRAIADPATRAVYYNAVFLLIVFGITGFFHPLSTEWSEWILFIVPYALFWKMASRTDHQLVPSTVE